MPKNDLQPSDTEWAQSLQMDTPNKKLLEQRGLCFDSVWGNTVHPAGKAGLGAYCIHRQVHVPCLIV